MTRTSHTTPFTLIHLNAAGDELHRVTMRFMARTTARAYADKIIRKQMYPGVDRIIIEVPECYRSEYQSQR